jgi:DNA-binding NarL/FixJ family response regulator
MRQKSASVIHDHTLTEVPPIRVEVNGPSAVTGTIRVAVVSRQRLIKEALTALLANEPGIEVVGATAQESGAVELIHSTRPHVVLVDIMTPGLEDLDLLPTIQHASPDAKMLLLTAAPDEALICRALNAGVTGYVSKEASISDLRKAIRGVYGGDVWVERRVLLRWLRGQVSAEVPGDDGPARMRGALTSREREILRLLAFGGTNKEIAKALLISDKTVKTHLNNIFRKLQVTRRLQAVLYAVRQGLR